MQNFASPLILGLPFCFLPVGSMDVSLEMFRAMLALGVVKAAVGSSSSKDDAEVPDVEEEELRRRNFFLLDALLLVSLGTPHVYANLGSNGRTDGHADQVERGLLETWTTRRPRN